MNKSTILGRLGIANFNHWTTHVQVQVILRPTVSRPVCLDVSSHLGLITIYLFLLDICGFHVEGRPPWREDWSVIYSYNLLSLSCPSPTELMATSCCLIGYHILLSHTRLPQPGWPGPCIYIPQEWASPVIPPGTGFRFCRLLRLAGTTVEDSSLHPHGSDCCSNSSHIATKSVRTQI
jgi:hypothetical protein